MESRLLDTDDELDAYSELLNLIRIFFSTKHHQTWNICDLKVVIWFFFLNFFTQSHDETEMELLNIIWIFFSAGYHQIVWY